MTNTESKSSKGTVSIEEFQNRLRLRKKALTIELDIASSNFDSSLKKYKPRNRAWKTAHSHANSCELTTSALTAPEPLAELAPTDIHWQGRDREG